MAARASVGQRRPRILLRNHQDRTARSVDVADRCILARSSALLDQALTEFVEGSLEQAGDLRLRHADLLTDLRLGQVVKEPHGEDTPAA